jgi:hypothetical protein
MPKVEGSYDVNPNSVVLVVVWVRIVATDIQQFFVDAVYFTVIVHLAISRNASKFAATIKLIVKICIRLEQRSIGHPPNRFLKLVCGILILELLCCMLSDCGDVRRMYAP